MSVAPPDPWSRLLELPRHGTGLALPRLAEICGPLVDRPLRRTLSLHVTGSNGKGSVSTFAAEILTALGLSTGLFTSPHLLHPGERIRIDGRPATDAEIAPAIERFLARRGEYLRNHPDEETGSFEALTAIALDHFESAGVEAAVYEAGLGGRLDPTRLARGPGLALASLDLEHTELLGGSLESIALEKAELCRDGGVLIAGPVPDEIERKLAAYCRLREIRPLFVGRTARVERLRSRRAGEPGLRFDLSWDRDLTTGLPLPPSLADLETVLPGRHQAWNAAVAAALVGTALHEAGHGVSANELAAAIRTGLARTRVPGRFERVRRAPDVYIDVGHTPAAARAAAETAEALRAGSDAPLVLLVGVSGEKKVEDVVHELIRPLRPETDRVVCTSARWHGAPAERVRRAVDATGWTGRIQILEKAADAVAAAIELAGRDGHVIVAGSLYLAAETTALLSGRDPSELRFF